MGFTIYLSKVEMKLKVFCSGVDEAVQPKTSLDF